MYEIGEHVGRDLRPFLHTESFQILDIFHLLQWTALFNSNHRFSVGFKSIRVSIKSFNFRVAQWSKVLHRSVSCATRDSGFEPRLWGDAQLAQHCLR